MENLSKTPEAFNEMWLQLSLDYGIPSGLNRDELLRVAGVYDACFGTDLEGFEQMDLHDLQKLFGILEDNTWKTEDGTIIILPGLARSMKNTRLIVVFLSPKKV